MESVQRKSDGSLEIKLKRMVVDAATESIASRGDLATSIERSYGANRTRGLKRRRNG